MIPLFKEHAVAAEVIKLTDGPVEVCKFSWQFQPWTEPIKDTYGGKTVLDSKGQGVFAELAIIPVLKQHGFEGAVWVDSFRRCFRDAMPPAKCELPMPLRDTYGRIVGMNGGCGGCWDVMAWNSEGVTFVECKRKGKDRMRRNGIKWLESALMAGIPLEQFVICEWEVAATTRPL